MQFTVSSNDIIQLYAYTPLWHLDQVPIKTQMAYTVDKVSLPYILLDFVAVAVKCNFRSCVWSFPSKNEAYGFSCDTLKPQFWD